MEENKLTEKQKEDLSYIKENYDVMREIQNQYNEINYYSTMLKFYQNNREDYVINWENFRRISSPYMGMSIIFFISYSLSGMWKWAIGAVLVFTVLPFVWQTLQHDKKYNRFTNDTPQIIKVANENLGHLYKKGDWSRIPERYRYIVPLNFANAAISRDLAKNLEEAFELYDNQLESLGVTRDQIYPNLVITSDVKNTEEEVVKSEKEALYINEVIDAIKLQHMKEGVTKDEKTKEK